MELLYKSTRSADKTVTASYAILKGLAEDGGLFVPTSFPKLDVSIDRLADMSYQEVAYEVMKLFLTDFTEEELKHCINSVLEDREDVLNVFVYAPLRNRVHRVMERHLIDSEDKARKEVLRTDKIRRTYYQYYSEYRWGEHESYDLMIDSSVFGIDGSVDVIVDAINRKFR